MQKSQSGPIAWPNFEASEDIMTTSRSQALQFWDLGETINSQNRLILFDLLITETL